MRTLQLTQRVEQGGHRVEIALSGAGARRAATAMFEWELEPQDREDLRWYLEDYLQHPIEPAPVIAARVERRLAALGRELFAKVFEANRDTTRLWDEISPHLPDTRVEVATTVEDAAAIPWELLRDPATDAVLALCARAFVRTHPQAAQAPALPETAGKIRVLLVICRPGGGDDVPFRSVASHLVRLSRTAREAFQLDVLRPPTFAQLPRVLRAAKERGAPYHVVHFDGHGTYTNLAVGAGCHGYLLFEKPGSPENIDYVDGTTLGNLLTSTGVPVLVLNACRSAHADLVTEPQEPDRDTDQRVQVYGSLAQEVIHAGVGGVVAMRYNVYVVTAARFVGDLYAALAEGQTLGAAVTAGRTQLAAQPDREIAFAPRPLQDWVVPVVYEAAPLALLAKPSAAEHLTITLDQAEAAAERAAFDPMLPAAPDVGFYGRDETLLALDRAFDTEQIVLLHAWAGGGKTSTAVEFSRWYKLTGGLDHGQVLFTAFTRHMPLARLLDQVETAFSRDLEAADIHWLTLSDAERRAIALQVLAQVPVLWIWDNVEPVAGFPAGTSSAWTTAEQAELVGFLRDLLGTKAKVLLTSRRDERGWLGNLPARLTMPPMPMSERVQLARAIAAKRGRQLTDVEDWQPLLKFTQGNPLTITVLVGQALHNGLRTRAQIEAFVNDLRSGAAEISDDVAQGRDKSLAASLSYGFAHAFTDHERAQLALCTCSKASSRPEPCVGWVCPRPSTACPRYAALPARTRSLCSTEPPRPACSPSTARATTQSTQPSPGSSNGCSPNATARPGRSPPYE
ncbi:MAG: CHAT domain-containing protein [Egibacteraceae bacterium]